MVKHLFLVCILVSASETAVGTDCHDFVGTDPSDPEGTGGAQIDDDGSFIYANQVFFDNTYVNETWYDGVDQSCHGRSDYDMDNDAQDCKYDASEEFNHCLSRPETLAGTDCHDEAGDVNNPEGVDDVVGSGDLNGDGHLLRATPLAA